MNTMKNGITLYPRWFLLINIIINSKHATIICFYPPMLMQKILSKRKTFRKNLEISEPYLVVKFLHFFLLILLLRFSHCFNHMCFTSVLSLILLFVWTIHLKVSKFIASKTFHLKHILLLCNSPGENSM